MNMTKEQAGQIALEVLIEKINWHQAQLQILSTAMQVIQSGASGDTAATLTTVHPCAAKVADMASKAGKL